MILLLREQTPADEPFVRALLRDTVAAELGADAWPAPVRAHLLGMQVEMRYASRVRQFPDGRGSVISIDGEDAGWLFVADSDHEVRIVDIVIAPGWRGRGAGTAILRGVLDDARAAQKRVRLSVEAQSSAARLYQRLGFVRCGGDDVHHELEYR